MQLKKASKKTTKATEKPAVSGGDTILSPETPKARAPKSSKAKKSEGAEMTSGKNLHKSATPAISAQTQNTPKITPPVEAKPVAAVSKKTIGHDEVARLAYTYWLERGGEHGFAEYDWLRAERELNGH